MLSRIRTNVMTFKIIYKLLHKQQAIITSGSAEKSKVKGGKTKSVKEVL